MTTVLVFYKKEFYCLRETIGPKLPTSLARVLHEVED
jgi:hypothetical protein